MRTKTVENITLGILVIVGLNMGLRLLDYDILFEICDRLGDASMWMNVVNLLAGGSAIYTILRCDCMKLKRSKKR